MNKRKLQGTLGERLRFAREMRGLSQAELAVRVGCTQGAIGNLERNLRNGRGETVVNIADALRVRYRWLKDGEGDVEASVMPQVAEQGSRYLLRSQGEKLLPLLTSEEAYHWRAKNYREPVHASKISVARTDLGKDAFALQLVGEAMVWCGAPTFPEGTLLIVSTEREPKAGDYVVAHDGASSRVTFKKLITDGIAWYLKPLNSEFKTIEIDSPKNNVIGVVVEYWFGGVL